MDDKLNWKDKLNLTVETGLQLVPYVGGALATAYFGTKQEKRFKRLETFYQEFSHRIEQLQLQLPPVESHDQDKLIALIEELNAKVENEITEQKRAYLKKYLYNILSSPTNENFDERRFFLDTLSSMTLLECEILTFLYHQNQPVKVGTITKPGLVQYAIVGAIGRLKMYGFLRTSTQDLQVGDVDNTLLELVTPSDFGLNFIKFCLE
ncbi:hypothetical protein KW850_18535 [Bacillus sp. sid0103]|uniref:hypothetical protein n=1 Tax=Bacillus sp. sid0103 TaxID=2856337 RepID=UPI001C4886AD|nr:hypothetical protein [Bacillus sp. sid0103]MBV7507263.1 hypothetical protein [Bacillus sp. sid0103]